MFICIVKQLATFDDFSFLFGTNTGENSSSYSLTWWKNFSASCKESQNTSFALIQVKY